MSVQSISFSNVPDALVAPVQSKPNYEKGKGVKSRFFWPKKLSNAMLNGKMVKLNLGGPKGRCSQVQVTHSF